MERIVFLDRAVIRTPLRAPAFPHHWREFPTTAPDQTRDRIRDATIVITNRIPLPADVLTGARRLRLISVAGTGVDGIDLDACRRLGITVVNTRDWCTYAVAEHTFALMFALRRDLLGARARVESGAWQRHHAFSLVGDRFPTDLRGATLGVIGYGALGWRVATLAHAIGMRVQIAEQRGRTDLRLGRTPFAKVLATSDILSLHCPLTPETRGLIGEDELRQMPRHALLINTSRGGIVDDRALARALTEGWIAGAGIDVLAEEPPRRGNPLLDLRLPNLIVTPHVAWASTGSLAALAEQVIANIESFVSGEPRHVVVRGAARATSA